ncbi:hypothetical protein NRF20_44725 [Streptomyces sp. R-74717]|uniref:hypothetical protein n=1 Tax=Streptomyces TaxID=1883 RepID=UPI0037A267DB
MAPVVIQSTLGVDAALGSEAPQEAGPLGTIDLLSHHQQARIRLPRHRHCRCAPHPASLTTGAG